MAADLPAGRVAPAATEAERLALLRAALTCRHRLQYVSDAEFHYQVEQLAQTMAIVIDGLAAAAVDRGVARASAHYRLENADPAPLIVRPGMVPPQPATPAPRRHVHERCGADWEDHDGRRGECPADPLPPKWSAPADGTCCAISPDMRYVCHQPPHGNVPGLLHDDREGHTWE